MKESLRNRRIRSLLELTQHTISLLLLCPAVEGKLQNVSDSECTKIIGSNIN